MARSHEIKEGDTLRELAAEFYNDKALYKSLARFNGIINPNKIFEGQIVELPSRRELVGVKHVQPEPVTGLTPPHGLEEILETFGDVYKYLATDGTLRRSFESRFMTRVKLPFSIPLSWDPAQSVKRLYCHKKLAPLFREIFQTIEQQGLRSTVQTFGGCFNFRSKRTSGKFSTHSWGIAIDMNPQTNRMGTTGNMDSGVVEVFRQFGFKWGGDWPGGGKDPMHFQFATGY